MNEPQYFPPEQAAALVPVIANAVCVAVRKVPRFPGWATPILAEVIGAISYPLLVGAWSGPTVLYGLIAGAGAVGLHQTAKQVMERNAK